MNKFNKLVEQTYSKINEESPISSSQFDPRGNRADISNRPVAKEEPKSLPPRGNHRDPETPDYTKPTGMYAIEGPNPEEGKEGGLGYWDANSGEFLYSKYTAPSSGIHKTSNREAAHNMVKKLREEHKDLSQTFVSKNTAWAKPDHNPFKVVQFFKR